MSVMDWTWVRGLAEDAEDAADAIELLDPVVLGMPTSTLPGTRGMGRGRVFLTEGGRRWGGAELAGAERGPEALAPEDESGVADRARGGRMVPFSAAGERDDSPTVVRGRGGRR